jgi:hypothetical protein
MIAGPSILYGEAVISPPQNKDDKASGDSRQQDGDDLDHPVDRLFHFGDLKG